MAPTPRPLAPLHDRQVLTFTMVSPNHVGTPPTAKSDSIPAPRWSTDWRHRIVGRPPDARVPPLGAPLALRATPLLGTPPLSPVPPSGKNVRLGRPSSLPYLGRVSTSHSCAQHQWYREQSEPLFELTRLSHLLCSPRDPPSAITSLPGRLESIALLFPLASAPTCDLHTAYRLHWSPTAGSYTHQLVLRSWFQWAPDDGLAPAPLNTGGPISLPTRLLEPYNAAPNTANTTMAGSFHLRGRTLSQPLAVRRDPPAVVPRLTDHRPDATSAPPPTSSGLPAANTSAPS